MSKVSRDNDWISSETEAKEQDFAGLLRMHMRMCKGAGSRWGGLPYLYVDLHAGPGLLRYDGREFEGSPLLSRRIGGEVGIPMTPVFCEIDSETRGQLAQNYGGAATVFGDNREFFDVAKGQYFPKNPQLGLIYYDPIREEVPYQELATANWIYPKTDILLYVAATQYKRRRGWDPVHWPDYLADHVWGIGKKLCIVRKPRGGNQYTFILLTNWSGMPAWTQRDFFRLDTEEGHDTMKKLNYSAREMTCP